MTKNEIVMRRMANAWALKEIKSYNNFIKMWYCHKLPKLPRRPLEDIITFPIVRRGK